MIRKDFKVEDREFVGFSDSHEITVVSHTDTSVVVTVSETRYSQITKLEFEIVDGKIVKTGDQLWNDLS